MKPVVMTFGINFCSRVGPRIEFDNPSPYGVITAPGTSPGISARSGVFL